METKMINMLSASLSNSYNRQHSPKNDAYINNISTDKRFSLTSNEEQQLTRILIQLKNKQIDSPTFIPCYKGKQQYLMNANDIEYIYSNSVTGVHICTNNEEFHTSWTLKTFEEQAVFTRCHRQYLINKRHIKMIEKLDNGLGKSHTYNGHIIPVSRRYLNEM